VVGNVVGGAGNAVGNVVGGIGNALFGDNMPQTAEALPVGAPPSGGTNSVDDWIRAARQKGLIP
jgi:hypothetical protein